MPALKVREPVVWFSRRMEGKLRKNDHRGRTGWRGDRIDWLLGRAQQELAEANHVARYSYFDSILENPEEYDRFIDECADAANMLMMAADEARMRMRREIKKKVSRVCAVCNRKYTGEYPACLRDECQKAVKLARYMLAHSPPNKRTRADKPDRQ